MGKHLHSLIHSLDYGDGKDPLTEIVQAGIMDTDGERESELFFNIEEDGRWTPSMSMYAPAARQKVPKYIHLDGAKVAAHICWQVRYDERFNTITDAAYDCVNGRLFKCES